MNKRWLIVFLLFVFSFILLYISRIKKATFTVFRLPNRSSNTSKTPVTSNTGYTPVTFNTSNTSTSVTFNTGYIPVTSNTSNILVESNTSNTPLTYNTNYQQAHETMHKLYHGKERRWIVVTSTDGSNDVTKELFTVQGWNVVVVGGNQCPAYRNLKNCFSVTIKNQPELLYNPSSINKNNSYALKNLGYLFAIRNGATTIYDTESGVQLLNGLKDFSYDQRFVGLQYSGKQSLFNSFRHFGKSDLKQRGFPLNYNSFDPNTFSLVSLKIPLIQHSLINGETDIDPVFKLVLQNGRSKSNVTFNTAAPPVIVKDGVFSPFNSKSTLFHYDALWALILPVTLPRSTSDVVRSYWTQRLLWEIGGTVEFLPPVSYRQQKTNILDVQGFYPFKYAALIEFLKQWTCPKELPFFQCVLLLAKDMVVQRFWNIEDHQVIKAWLKQLRIFKYKEPIRNLAPTATEYGEKVVYLPRKLGSSSGKSQHLSRWNQLLAITNFCQNSFYQISKSNLIKASFPNILLVILFNGPYYSNVPYLNMIYGVQFDHIIYCGPNIDKFLDASKNFSENVTFIEKDVMGGRVVYGCVSAAMKMNFNVDGYLAIGDDTLLNTWNIKSLPLNKIWLCELTPLFRDKKNPTWSWWRQAVGRAAFNKAWTEMLKIKQQSPQLNLVVTKFVKILQQNTGSIQGLYKGASDIVYIPKIYRNKTILFLDLFLKNKVFLEVAVPTLVGGLCPLADVVRPQGQYLWYDGKRERVPELFKKEDIFMHPVKISNIKHKLKNFYCKTFFPLL